MEAKKLEIWQTGIDLAEKVYKITAEFPKTEVYGIIDQMRRAAVSVSSNIAEGKGRNTSKDFINFLHHAKGSLCELETQCTIANRIGYLQNEDLNELTSICENLEHRVNGLIRHLKNYDKK